MNTFANEPEVKWSSFMPALGYALAGSKGAVLELGAGHFSTPFLHSYCESAGRPLFSVEADPEWGAMFSSYNTGGHVVQIGQYESLMKDLVSGEYGVVFIDNSPGGKARSDPFKALIGRSEFVVVHDYHRENSLAIQPIINKLGAKHRVWAKYDPPTLVASLTKQL